MLRNKFFALELAFAFVLIFLLYTKALKSEYLEPLFFLFYLFFGRKVFINTAKDLLEARFIRESFLMTVASLGAIYLGEFNEALAVLIFYRIGIFFEDLAIRRSKNSISSLLSMKAQYANLIQDEKSIKKVSLDELLVGDKILIKAYEKVPVDCVIYENEGYVDTKALTGESMPRQVGLKDELLAGFINTNKPLKAIVTKEAKDSLLSKLLELISKTEKKKSKLENFVSKFSKFYTPIVVFLALLLALVPLIFSFSNFELWIERALSLLVVSCPCAFVIAVPLTYFTAIGRASKLGIMFKGSVFLDILAKSKFIVFDKTGTLTSGEFSLKKMKNFSKFSKEELLKYLALAELNSKHPLALCILKEAEKNKEKLEHSLIKKHTELSGFGVLCELEDKKILVGKEELFKDIKNFKKDDDFNVFMAINDEFVAGFAFDDTIKEDSKESLAYLNQMGIKSAILSGDKKARVQNVAKELDIKLFKAECLPHEKLEFLQEYMKKEKNIVFVGDGINDALCLINADLGIAMGKTGSDIAIENADVVFMDDKISKLKSSIQIARKNKIIIWQNITLALGLKFIALILASLGFLPIALAIFADTGLTILVVLNALRQLYGKEKIDKNTKIQEFDIGVKCCSH